MRWYIGPWVWDATFPQWRPPMQCGAIDFRSLPEQSQAGGTPGLGLFYGDVVLGSDYALLGEGNWYDIKLSQQEEDALPRRRGYNPKGPDLVGLIYDLFTDGADPDGMEFAKPLVPGIDGRIKLHARGQHHAERFQWGKHHHYNQLRAQLRREFSRLMDEALAGKLRDDKQHLRVLDSWCDKYNRRGEDEWKDFVPPNRLNDVPGPVKHDTTISDDFTRADGDTIGNQLTWTEVAGDLDTASNTVVAGVNDTYCFGRAESDLSSDDHYSQALRTINSGSSKQFGPVCRFSSSAVTGYLPLCRQSDGLYRIYKWVAGTPTLLDDNTLTLTTNTFKTLTDGSDVKIYMAGANEQSVVDTAITGNLRCGLMAYTPAADPAGSWDNFEAADLAAPPGVLFTQLENSWPRGLARGIWTR